MKKLLPFIAFLLAPALHAQEAPRFLGKTAPDWAAQLAAGPDLKSRRAAAFALGSMDTHAASVVEPLKRAFAAEAEPKVREAIAAALGEIGRQSVTVGGDAELERLLCQAAKSDRDPLVRRSAAGALGMLGSRTETTRAALEAALADEAPAVRQNAAWALGQLGEKALPALKKALHDADPLVRRDAAGVIAQMRDGDEVRAQVLDDLLPLCRDEHSEVRRAAVTILVTIVDRNDAKAVAPLSAAIEDRDVEIRRNAALALSNIGGPPAAKAVPILLEALRTGDLALRRQATLALRNLGPEAVAAVPDLVKLLKFEPDAELRANAALALGGIGPTAEAAVPALVERVLDPMEASETRQQSAIAMRLIGPVPAAVEALPRLLALVGDGRQDGRVRLRVVYTLWRHQGRLAELASAYDTFTRVLTEPPREDNTLLRYNCAATLGLFWRDKAEEPTLNVLLDFLRDTSTKIIDRTQSTVGGTGNETGNGTGKVNEILRGDGRLMAVESLKSIGATRVRTRPDLVRQLQTLADDPAVFADLRTEARALAKMAK